ncbi:hypothetical protein [Gottfriedia acidiceleris]|uniref:hypothetical protein n=1 Tax=Gottfriedia acidiceleris TaxID=371036 RepID=UPI00101D12BA|nr:hypothetical protein [Gottfriedia acidiceleris]
MLKSKIRIAFLVIILCSVLFIFLKPSTQVYGNSERGIMQAIQSTNGYEDKDAIEILKIFDSKNDRTVAFLYNNQPAYIHFYKNKDGNYKWTNIESYAEEPLSMFLVQLGKDLNLKHMLVVSNSENPVSKMKIKVIGESTKEIVFVLHPKSAVLMKLEDMPKAKDNKFEYEYEYFDKDGNKITENDLMN